jgi:prolyl oligopeptidase
MLRSSMFFVLGAALFGLACTEEAPPATPPQPEAPPPAPATTTAAHAVPALAYPATRAVDQKDTLFGVEVKDPFRWLEDVKSPEVQQWMKDEDALARGYLAKLPERDAIAARLKELYYIDSLSAPHRRQNRFFYGRRLSTKEKRIVYWKEGKTGAEKTLLDPNVWTSDGSETLGGWWAAWDGQKVAYTVKKNNSDEATMYVMDVATGKKSAVDTIEGAKYAEASWTPDSRAFYYTYLPTDSSVPTSDRSGLAEVRLHKLGTDPKKDPIVHEKTGDPSKFIGGEVSRDGRWLILYIQNGWTSVDVYFKDARDAKAAWTPLVVGKSAHYAVEAYKDAFYVTTDEGAPHSKVLKVDPKHPEPSAWKVVVAERPDATLDSAQILGGALALRYLKDVASRLELHDLDGKLIREVKLPGLGSVDGLVGLPEDDTVYYGFESFTTPHEIYSTSIKSGASELYAKVKVPIDPSGYAIEQQFAQSKDGTKVSLFIVHKKDMKKDGSNKVLLYGYGGFQAVEAPSFISTIYPWIERGGVYVLANLRGGGEYGEDWHKSGMLLKKQNVFDDYIAAAEYLIKDGITKPEHLASWGASNGGLLVGATLVQRPDLFGAALCGVPLIDMVRYHLFGSGKTWISEYGSAENADQFKALYAYSPYHHVTLGTKYPAVLLASADSDDRVDPMHARKFGAALQANSAGGPVILRIEKNSGHGGADLVKANVEKNADQLAFALANTK